MQQLEACKQTCPGGGQGRRDCRAACAERSTCTAPGARIRTLALRGERVPQRCPGYRAPPGPPDPAGRLRPVTVLEFPFGERAEDAGFFCREALAQVRHGGWAVILGNFQ